MKILITSVGTATSVNLIKYFHKLGDMVIGTDVNDLGFTAGSLLVDEFYKVSLAVSDNYLSEISSIIRKVSIDLFIPVNDIEVLVVSKNKSAIDCKVLIPEYDLICKLRDKYICSKMLMERGIDVPEIISNTDTYLGKRILRDRIGVGSKGIQVLDNNEPVGDFDKNIKFVQKFVEGDEYTIDVLTDSNGFPIYIIPRKRLEVKGGVATKVAVLKDDKLIGHVKSILKHYLLPGFSNFQFIKDKDGNCWFIEINYRFSGCGAATLACTEHYLETYKKIACGEQVSKQLNEDVKWNCIVTRYFEEIVYENSFC